MILASKFACSFDGAYSTIELIDKKAQIFAQTYLRNRYMIAQHPENRASAPRISLEQWRCLAAVVEAGGYAQAAVRLNKSQSSVTYAVQKLERMLKVRAFEIQGRKAVLTGVGQMLYRRGRTLLDDAGELERAARKASAGWEAEIGLAVEVLFPTWLMFVCLNRFGA